MEDMLATRLVLNVILVILTLCQLSVHKKNRITGQTNKLNQFLQTHKPPSQPPGDLHISDYRGGAKHC